jgi:hypothetical protein
MPDQRTLVVVGVGWAAAPGQVGGVASGTIADTLDDGR